MSLGNAEARRGALGLILSLTLGRLTDIGAFTYIQAQNGVTVEDGVQIGSHCASYSVSTIDGKAGPVLLKRNCRIGSHCVVMPGVTVGEGATVGACSFVTEDVPAGATAFAVPARVRRRVSRLYLSPPWLGGDEQRLVAEAIASNCLAPLGPHVDAFEREFAARVGLGHAAALASGTAALHLALAILGVRPGDEVLAPTLTFVGGVSPVVHLGATPVFVTTLSSSRTWSAMWRSS